MSEAKEDTKEEEKSQGWALELFETQVAALGFICQKFIYPFPSNHFY